MNDTNPLGRHLIVEYRNCNPEILNDVSEIEKIMTASAQQAGATIINTTFHHFSPWGVSGVIVIQESHLAIHTWPEYGYALVDLFTCGDSVNPWIAFKYLKKVLKAQQHEAIEMLRGHPELLEKTGFEVEDSSKTPAKNLNPTQLTRDLWFTERTGNFAFSVKHNGGLLLRKITPYQKIEVYQTPSLGKMLVLDGLIVLTENDEYAYHEMLAHTALYTHPNPKNVLIIGGGDGGVAREVLKHKNIESITLVEIDEMIIETSKKFFPFTSQTFANPKLTIKVADAWDYMGSEKELQYDIILVDLGNPTGGDDKFYSQEFCHKITEMLTSEGLFVTQIGSPMINKELFKNNFQVLKRIFGPDNTHCYLAHIPTYPSGTCGFAYCSKIANDHFTIDAGKNTIIDSMELRYFNRNIHKAAFALPNFISSNLL